VSPRRLDLGAALGLAGDVLAGESRPGEITLLTDLQASAVSAADLHVPLVVGRPDGPPPRNVGIARARDRPPALERRRRAAHGVAGGRFGGRALRSRRG
jgi:hypothetical protein